MHRLVAGLIRRDLRRAFRRVVWAGAAPALPTGPIVALANHQSFFDGYLLWLAATALVGRDFLVWMEEADRFPFFALQGALPFPADDATRRAATIRRTRRLLHARRPALLAYFPEGDLHATDEPVRAIPPDTLQRLHEVLGRPAWWPVAIHATWRGDDRPTALLAAGAATPSPPVDPTGTLERLRDRLRRPPDVERVLLEGRASAHERWAFPWMRAWVRHRPGAG